MLVNKDAGDDVEPGEHVRRAGPSPLAGGFSGTRAGLWPVTPPSAANGEVGEGFQGESRLLFVGGRDLHMLMQGEGPEDFRDRPVRAGELAQLETRVGIAREIETRRVLDGQLYSLGVHRWSSRTRFGRRETFGLVGRVENVEVEAFPSRFCFIWVVSNDWHGVVCAKPSRGSTTR